MESIQNYICFMIFSVGYEMLVVIKLIIYFEKLSKLCFQLQLYFLPYRNYLLISFVMIQMQMRQLEGDISARILLRMSYCQMVSHFAFLSAIGRSSSGFQFLSAALELFTLFFLVFLLFFENFIYIFSSSFLSSNFFQILLTFY